MPACTRLNCLPIQACERSIGARPDQFAEPLERAALLGDRDCEQCLALLAELGALGNEAQAVEVHVRAAGDGDEGLAVPLEADVDAVAGGAGHLADDDAFLARQGVDEGALSGLYRAHHGDPKRLLLERRRHRFHCDLLLAIQIAFAHRQTPGNVAHFAPLNKT